jgi:hypothetical protein
MTIQSGSFFFRDIRWDYVVKDNVVAVSNASRSEAFIAYRVSDDGVVFDLKQALCLRFGGHRFAMVYDEGRSCLSCGCDNTSPRKVQVLGCESVGSPVHRTFICDRITEDAVADAKRALCSRFGGHEFAMVYNDGYGCLNCGCSR